jgi:hypothetical protein
MIETGKVDLSDHFSIKFVECECGLTFRGYFLENVAGEDDLFDLVKLA